MRPLPKICVNTRVWKIWFIVQFNKEIPPLFSLFLKMLEICFCFDLLLIFNVRGQNLKNASFISIKTGSATVIPALTVS